MCADIRQEQRRAFLELLGEHEPGAGRFTYESARRRSRHSATSTPSTNPISSAEAIAANTMIIG
jgi:hypothetical protein